jgi:hypothetical protein
VCQKNRAGRKAYPILKKARKRYFSHPKTVIRQHLLKNSKKGILMKKTIPSIALLLVIGFMNARANHGDPLSHEIVSSKKTAPVVHNILSDQLPARLLTDIKKNYKSYWITALCKKTANGKASYYMTLENADQKVSLSAFRPTNWSVTRVSQKI